MKLQSVGAGAIAESLSLEILARGEQNRPAWQLEAFAMPLIDVIGERAVADIMAIGSRPDRIIADFDLAFGMGIDAMAEVAGEHLGAETDAKGGLSSQSGTSIQSISRRSQSCSSLR